jgi:DhnA family fructose-bisphosphate aldolase class Ia
MAEEKLRLVTADSALQGPEGRIWQVAVTRAAAIAEQNCDAVKVLMAWEDDLESRARTLELVARLLEEGHHAGLPVLVEAFASGPTVALDDGGPDDGEIERRELESARIAVEAGADIIQMRSWGSEACRRFVSSSPVPVVALGGAMSGESAQVVDTIKQALDIGMRGIFVGRNIWQRPRSEGLTLMETICELVHE